MSMLEDNGRLQRLQAMEYTPPWSVLDHTRVRRQQMIDIALLAYENVLDVTPLQVIAALPRDSSRATCQLFKETT